eukprot:XP_001697344.1 predicted protein [Chlamydomonas reinhardtii]
MDSGDSGEGPPSGGAERGGPGSEAGAGSSSGAPGGEAGEPLTLGAGVLSRMRQLRALDEYRQLMEQLAEGALLIARHRYPELDEAEVRGVLDDMARKASALLPAEAERRYPLRVVAAINRVMYVDYGFRGNQEDYYSADNSCINKVVERRVGIPITLSLVYMEVGRRLGLTLRGVNLPGHFMIQPVCYPAEAEERLSELLGAPVRIDPQLLKESRPLPPRTFLLRMLSNLRSIYLSTQQVDSLLTVVKFMRATLEAAAPEAAAAPVDPSLVSPEEAQTVAAVLEEARRRMRLNRPDRD